MKVLILDTFHESLQLKLEENGHECLNMSNSPDSEVLLAMPFAEILVLRSRMSIRQEQIDACPNLKIIGRVGAGLEHIDVDYARSRGVKVLSSPEGNRQAVAEHAIGMLLTLFNNIAKSNNEVRDGLWMRKENEGVELAGKTIGIIGYGNTGSAFAQVLSGFGVKVLAFDKYKTSFEFESRMDQIFSEADIVSLHLPLNAETKYLVNDTWIHSFQKPFYLINTSRGPIVNTEDLIQAINQKHILGACLDVLEYETENLKMPPIKELPTSALDLMKCGRVILSPHIAGLTKESYEKLSKILAEKILVASS